MARFSEVGLTLIFVGDELLSGHTQNTNAFFLAKIFKQAGYPVAKQLTVPDDKAIIKQTILDNQDKVLVVCGGLGSTKDDVTVEAVALALNREIVNDQKHLAVLKGIQKKRKLNQKVDVGDVLLRQARKPSGAFVQSHRYGTAPFIALKRPLKKKDFGWIYFLAGVPRECLGVAKDFLLPHLKKQFSAQFLASSQLVVIGVSEVVVQKLIEKFLDEVKQEKYKQVTASYLPQGGRELFVSLSAPDKNLVKKFAKELLVFLKKQGCYVYGGDDNFFHHCHKKLKDFNFPLVIAESCTGGALCSALVRNQGASSYFLNGLVVYSNFSKQRLLGVRSSTLAINGAVSKQTATEMVRGIFATTKAQIAIAITGFAGPATEKGVEKNSSPDKNLTVKNLSAVKNPSTFSEDNPLKSLSALQKPVGLVYIAIGLSKQAHQKAMEKKAQQEKAEQKADQQGEQLSFVEQGKQATAFFSEERECLLRVEKFLFSGTREEVQDKSVKSAMLLLAQMLF